MSEETSGIEQLIKLMQEIHIAVQILTNNQERLVQEQQRAGKAIGEAGTVLRMHQKVIEALADQAGVTFTSPHDIVPNDPVN